MFICAIWYSEIIFKNILKGVLVMGSIVKDTLLSEEQIQNKVKELGEQISKDYEGKDVIFIGVLKGSVVFISDLIRKMSINVTMDFMAVSSYGSSTETSGVVKILKDLDSDIEGKDVIIVEDIIDTGITLKYLCEYIKARGPKSLKICCLLDKPERRRVDIPVDYIGFSIPDEFVVGYGIDYAERFRQLPYIGIVRL
jgi:hypoxanthine phosphoribosyltransferase